MADDVEPDAYRGHRHRSDVWARIVREAAGQRGLTPAALARRTGLAPPRIESLLAASQPMLLTELEQLLDAIELPLDEFVARIANAAWARRTLSPPSGSAPKRSR